MASASTTAHRSTLPTRLQRTMSGRRPSRSSGAGGVRSVSRPTSSYHDAAVYFGGDPVADREQVYVRFSADVQMYATGPGIDPQRHLSGLTCDQIPDAGNNWGGSNVPRSCDPGYDEMVEELTHTSIGPGRNELVKRMNDAIVQGYSQIPLDKSRPRLRPPGQSQGRAHQWLGQ